MDEPTDESPKATGVKDLQERPVDVLVLCRAKNDSSCCLHCFMIPE